MGTLVERRGGTFTPRLPDPRIKAERPLHEANGRGRALAAAGVRRALAVDLDAWAQESDAHPFRVHHAAPFAAEIDAAGLVHRLLERGALAPPRVKVARDGRQLHAADHPRWRWASDGRLDHALLDELLDEGWTVVLQGLDRHDLGLTELAAWCERVIGWRVNINGYLSRGDGSAFGPHWDGHDGLVVQLAGSKRWAVHQPVGPAPNRRAFDDAIDPRVAWDGVVRPGDVLELPRGWGHDARTAVATSFHLTITLPRVDGLMAARVLASMLEPGWLDLPLGDVTSWVTPFRNALAHATSTTGLADLLAAFRASVPPRHLDPGPPSAPGAGRPATVTFPAPGGVVMGSPPDAPLILIAAGVGYAVDPSAIRGLAPLLDGGLHSVGTSSGPEVNDAMSSGLLEPGIGHLHTPDEARDLSIARP